MPMKLKTALNVAIEFGPLLVFLIASEMMSFVNATIVFVLATVLALIMSFIERRRIAPFPLLAGIVVIAFGLFTIILKDPFYLIVKDTLYNGIFALVLFYGLAKGSSLLKPLFDGLFSMTDRGWKTLTLRWGVMFAILAVTNEIARIIYDPEQWLTYKMLATISTIIFMFYQFKLSKEERLPDSTKWGMRIH